MKPITKQELMELFDESVHAKIENLSRENAPAYLVVFENQDIWSSRCGDRTVVAVGPACTYKTLEHVRGKHLNDLPSQRQYPVAYWEVEPSLATSH